MHSLSRCTPVLFLGLLLLPAALPAETVAISSKVFNGYARAQLPDGTFKPESYVFGEGGAWTRAINDPTMEKLTFVQVARVVAGPLAKVNYHPALTSADAGLLILVFWGSTQGSSSNDSSMSLDRAASALSNYNLVKPADPSVPVDTKSPEGAAMDAALWQLSVANGERDDLDERNARILGYTEALDRARFTQHMAMGHDVLQELGDNHYFIVLKAYDFPTALKEKKLKLMWLARLSVAENRDFAQALEKMAASGARYFGKDSDGLLRRRAGSVDHAPMKVLEVVPDKK